VNQREPVRDRRQATSLRGGVDVLRHVRGVHDLGQPDERGIIGQPELLDEDVERALPVPVGVFRARRIVGVPAFAFCRRALAASSGQMTRAAGRSGEHGRPAADVYGVG
jgi:hypothetical protein